MKTFDQELLEHIEFLNLLAMIESNPYEKKQIRKIMIDMVKILNKGDKNEISR